MGSGSSKAHEAFAIAPAPSTHQLFGADETDLVDVDLAELFEEPNADVPAPATHDDSGDWITPIPDTAPVGDVGGTPLLLTGHDLDNSSVTLVAYDSPDGPRHVLYGWVDAAAEHKIHAALALDEEQLIPTTVTKQVSGRLPIDTEHQLYEKLVVVAKSVNHHLKAADGIPAHTHSNHAELVAKLDELDATATADEKQMLASYRAACDTLADRLDPAYAVPYSDGGKVDFVPAYETDSTVTVTEMIPGPADDVSDGLLAATVRQATRIKPTLAADGTGSWDGSARFHEQGGVEYRIDLGDGFEAVYRPHATDQGATAKAGHRGFLEVTAPAGADQAPDRLVRRLGQLNLSNRPMTADEAQWTYLTRNVWAQGLSDHPQVAAAVAEASLLDDSMTELVFAERAHEALGMTDQQLTAFARDIRLEGEARALGPKTRMLGEAVAAAQGHDSFDELRAIPTWDPTPRASGGWHTWTRWDVSPTVGGGTDFHGRVLYHRVTGNNLDAIFANSGLLAATERRRVMGIPTGIGMSETADMFTGGSRAVDLRIGSAPSKGPCLVWSDPARLLRRSDWYAYNGDHFAAFEGPKAAGQTRSPAKVAGFTSSDNEVLFRDGIDLTSPHEAPDRIVCSSKKQRSAVLAALEQRGVTHLAGVPIDKAVTT